MISMFQKDLSKSYTRRPAAEGDKEFCFSTARRSYEEVVAIQFGEWDDPWQRKEFEKKWDPSKLEILELEGIAVGVLWTEWREDHFYVAEIEILPEYQGFGIGTSIIRDAQAKAAARGFPVRLQVLKMNRARALYERLGFNLCGETATHYQMVWSA